MLTSLHIFLGLISSTFISDLYGLMQHILCLICIIPYCKFTAPLEKNHKWSLIWRFVFVCSVISEYDFISDIIGVVNLVYIFADIVFINLSLLSLTY